jgi:hypothetical protein
LSTATPSSTRRRASPRGCPRCRLSTVIRVRRVTPVTANSTDGRCVFKITPQKLIHSELTRRIKAFYKWADRSSGLPQQTHPVIRGGYKELRKCLSRSSAQTRSAPVVGGASMHGSTHCRIRLFARNCWQSSSGTSSASADAAATGFGPRRPSEISPGAVIHGSLADHRADFRP